jgi:hypothetical protein
MQAEPARVARAAVCHVADDGPARLRQLHPTMVPPAGAEGNSNRLNPAVRGNGLDDISREVTPHLVV